MILTSASAAGCTDTASAFAVFEPDPTSPGTKLAPIPWTIAPTMSRARHSEALSIVSATGVSAAAPARASDSEGSAA